MIYRIPARRRLHGFWDVLQSASDVAYNATTGRLSEAQQAGIRQQAVADCIAAGRNAADCTRAVNQDQDSLRALGQPPKGESQIGTYLLLGGLGLAAFAVLSR